MHQKYKKSKFMQYCDMKCFRIAKPSNNSAQLSPAVWHLSNAHIYIQNTL